MTTKPTNPKDAIGSSKVPFSTVPARVVGEVGLALLEGACKYGRHNYRTAGVRASVYFDASSRHLAAWWEGQDLDPDSGLSHVTKAIASLVVLRDSMLSGNWNDDRPPAVSGDWVAAMNSAAAGILERYPEPMEPHTQIGQLGLGITFVPNHAIECRDPVCDQRCMSPAPSVVASSAEPSVRLRCSECGRSWPIDESAACPECYP